MLPWLTAILMVLGIAVLAGLYWNRTVTVEQVEITGNYFTTAAEVENSAQITFGVNPDSIDLDLMIQRVSELPYVKSASPYVEPNGDLKLTIKERIPIAVLIDENEQFYVDEEGVVLPIINEKAQHLPLVYGFNASTSDTIRTADFLSIRDFLVSAIENEFGWATISEIAYTANDGVVALTNENGVKLIFGQDNYDVKLSNWEAFYANVIKTKGIQSMKQVDLRFTNQVVTRES